jgi:hypothetical protein
MELLDNRWIFSKQLNKFHVKFYYYFLYEFFSEKQCSDRSSAPATLGLHNMLGKNEI